MPIDSQVVNGRIIGPNGAELSSLEIDAGKILSVDTDTEPWREVDASGFYVLPGAVQPGNPDADHSLALINQGITSAIVRVACTAKDLKETIDRLDRESILDFTVCWAVPADATPDDIRQARNCGVSSFEVTGEHKGSDFLDALSGSTVRIPADSAHLDDWLNATPDTRFMVRINSAEALPSVLRAKAPGKSTVFVEVCANALDIDGDPLWNAVIDGTVDLIAASDHDIPFLQFLYREGIEKRGLSMSRLAELCATGPATAYGLARKKGRLEIDADADFVVFDPEQTSEIDGASIQGKVVYAQLRGEILLFNNELHLAPGDGKRLTADAS